jgi:hypothetical protein
MTSFKVGDKVATIFTPWQAFVVAKVKTDKIKLGYMPPIGWWSQFFPVIYMTLPTYMVIEYKEPRGFGEKPPVSDPQETGDKPA